MLTVFSPGGMKGVFEATGPLLDVEQPDLPLRAETVARWSTRLTGPPIATGPWSNDASPASTLPTGHDPGSPTGALLGG